MRTLLILSSAFILFSCSERQVQTDNNSVNDSSQTLIEVNSDSLILTLTKQVLTSIKHRDFKKLSDFIHPILGVRFSPYAYIDTTTDMKFTADNFIDQIKKRNKFNWGNYDGSGDTIFLTIEDYFSRFVYNADFLNAEKISLNKMIGGGNSLNNLETVYIGCRYSESYFSGFDKKFNGMDWCSLRLVFKRHQENFYLVGVVHDQWTI